MSRGLFDPSTRFPVMVGFHGALCVGTRVLDRREGKRFAVETAFVGFDLGDCGRTRHRGRIEGCIDSGESGLI